MNFLKYLFEKPAIAPITIFHEFHKPPYGGGNQFLLALKKEFENKEHRVGVNRVSARTKTCLFNSFNFNFRKLKSLRHRFPHLRMVHRVDGPVSVYRGNKDDDTDMKICKINNELANATVFQSEYSLNRHSEMGLKFIEPVIIHNAVDPNIFNPKNRTTPPDGRRKLKIIASSWSDNPRKGGPVYKWLEDNLDWNKYEFTFVGRTQQEFTRAKHIPACPSEEIAELLRQHDIYITASQDDPCSNALIEALSCGLPVIYLNSGGHPELVKEAGIGFVNRDEIPMTLNNLAENYHNFQAKIRMASIEEVAQRYLRVLMPATFPQS